VTELDFLLLDVFTDSPFGGSHLTVFPDGSGLSSGLMQRLAQEMGAGETAFVHAETGAPRQNARLRVFTPQVEIPFAGHAILGATFALDELDRRGEIEHREPFVWTVEAGRYDVTHRDLAQGRIYSLRHDEPAFLGEYYHRGKVARALGLEESDLAITGLPCEIISTGLPIHIVPVGSLAAVNRAQWRRREAEAVCRDLGFADFYLFTFETESPEATVHCRMFAPHFGIPEDPASGAAFGSLAAYLVKHRLVRSSQRLALIGEQGLEMGRPSRLFVDAQIVDGRAVDIHVGGQCVLVGRGRIQLPRSATA
jgi:trans-2,3-dihydro-3-hydroxyanthranilate isomerase